MKRSDFPKPFSTALVDLNSVGAFADQGMTPRAYPRYLPVPYTSIAPVENKLPLEYWRKNMKLYPQLFFLVAKDVQPKSGEDFSDAVLGLGLGLATSDDGIAMASPNPAARDLHMCYWYSLYSDNAQVLAQEMKPGLRARDLKITIESPTLGKHVFDQSLLQFDPAELMQEMNFLVAFRKYDLISLGAADKPLSVPVDKKFQPGEVITISCPELGKLEITVDDQRDPEKTMPGWTPREYFLDSEYRT